MKDFEVNVTIFNNCLRQRRLDAGMTLEQMGKAIKTHSVHYCRLETLKISPLDMKGKWTSTAEKLAIYYTCLPEDLFPEAVRQIKKTQASFKADMEMLLPLVEPYRQGLFLKAPDELCELKEIFEKIEENVTLILKPREKEIIYLYYGITDKALTMKEVGDRFNISRARVEQIINDVIVKIREALDVEYLEDGRALRVAKRNANKYYYRNKERILRKLTTKRREGKNERI